MAAEIGEDGGEPGGHADGQQEGQEQQNEGQVEQCAAAEQHLDHAEQREQRQKLPLGQA